MSIPVAGAPISEFLFPWPPEDTQYVDLVLDLPAARIGVDIELPLQFLQQYGVDLELPLEFRLSTETVFGLAIYEHGSVENEIDLAVRSHSSVDTELSLGFLQQYGADTVLPLSFVLAAETVLDIAVYGHGSVDLELDLAVRSHSSVDLVLDLNILVWDSTELVLALSTAADYSDAMETVIPLPIWAAHGGIDETTTITVVRDSDGLVIGVTEAEISIGEGDVHWTASMVLSAPGQIHDLAIQDALTVTCGSLSLAVIIESKDYSRDGVVGATAILRCISPTIALDAPLASAQSYSWSDPMLASAIADEIATGYAVDWDRDDWIVLPYRFAVSDSTPLNAMDALVTASGGMLYADPDGQTIHIRDAVPVTVTSMGAANPNHTLTYRDHLFRTSQTDTLAVGINRVRVYDLDVSERYQVDTDEDGLSATIRVYPSPWTAGVTVRTTRGDMVSVVADGADVVTVTDEVVEIKEGAGTTAYPILALSSAEYLSDDLGAITTTPYSPEIRTAEADYTLMRVSYTTKSLKYTATSSEVAQAQFVVEAA
jgi:hypothetical protein